MRIGRAVAVGAVALVATSALGAAAVRWTRTGAGAVELSGAAAGRVDSQNGDCGWTAPLGDGEVLWVVCDPTALPGGLTNSVAVTGPEDRSPPFQPVNFVPPAPSDLGRCADLGGAASWIDGVTTTAGASVGTTLITAFFIHGCRVSMLDGSEAGTVGVATATYVHGSTDTLRSQVLNWDLFPGAWSSGERTVLFGRGAVHDGDYQYAYGCIPEASPSRTNEAQCSIARASVDSAVGARESWAFWRGADDRWVACTPRGDDPARCDEASFRAAVEAAAPLDMPLPDGEGPEGFTPLQFSVSWSESLGMFVAAAPRAFGDATLRVRVATSPEGPWSEPGDVPVDCRPTAVVDGFNCYHFAAHPELDDRDVVVFHAHDAGNPTSADLELIEVSRCEVMALAVEPCG